MVVARTSVDQYSALTNMLPYASEMRQLFTPKAAAGGLFFNRRGESQAGASAIRSYSAPNRGGWLRSSRLPGASVDRYVACS